MTWTTQRGKRWQASKVEGALAALQQAYGYANHPTEEREQVPMVVEFCCKEVHTPIFTRKGFIEVDKLHCINHTILIPLTL